MKYIVNINEVMLREYMIMQKLGTDKDYWDKRDELIKGIQKKVSDFLHSKDKDAVFFGFNGNTMYGEQLQDLVTFIPLPTTLNNVRKHKGRKHRV